MLVVASLCSRGFHQQVPGNLSGLKVKWMYYRLILKDSPVPVCKKCETGVHAHLPTGPQPKVAAKATFE